jgi:hypothetical protein
MTAASDPHEAEEARHEGVKHFMESKQPILMHLRSMML